MVPAVRFVRVLLAGLLLSLMGLAAGAAPGRAAKAPPAAAPMRLPATVQPLAVQLQLDIDPDQPRHSGQVQIDLQLHQHIAARGAIRLHAKALQLQQVWLEQGARRWRGKAVVVDAERVDLHFGQPLAAGPARLLIDFAGLVNLHDVYGIFRQQEQGRWFAFTQFQATGARQAFPLFDEPGWKLPWTLTLTVPQALTAVANMPVAAEEAAGAGRKRVRFQPTPPMPSYLLAFAVGQFDVRDAGWAGLDHATPLHFITPTGRADQAAYAAGITGPILNRLEAWFGMPHPYAKLDSLAFPVGTNFSAMEHAGLITYASTTLLASPVEQTPQFERAYVATAAHELAHQWFGNLVTMAWWDDLWLNESFASWLGDKITAEVQPAWGWHTSLQLARARAMRADRLVSARRIQQPVLQDGDMGNLWDAITYEKGQAVLGMAEAWVGADAFQAGVRRYIQRHAWGSASSSDFFATIAGDDADVPDAIRSFTSQGGIPLLNVTLRCDDGPPRLHLAQSRLLPLGSPATASQRWLVPVQVRTPAGLSRLLLRDAQATLPLPDATCPAWVQPNAGGTGYYRSLQGSDGLQRLAESPGLPTGEWLVLLDDARGLHAAGAISSTQLVALVRRAAGVPHRQVQQAAVDVLLHLRPLVQPGRQADYARLWRAALGARAGALGWLPLATDTDDDRQLRPVLLPAVAVHGQDTALQQQAVALAQAWLADRSTLPADLRAPVLATAAQASGPGSGEPLFNALALALAASTVRTERGDLLAALGHFRQPALAQRARALLLNPQIDLRDSLSPLLQAQAADPPSWPEALAWVLHHHATLAKRMDQDDVARLPRQFNTGCSAADAQALRSGFGPLAPRWQGGRQALAGALEAVQLCSAWRAQQGLDLPGL